MGDVYRTVGADYQHFDEILEKCSVRYQNEVLTDCQYAQEIRADGQYLLTQCGLAESLEVWEIQPEEEILLFVLGKENKQIATCFVDGTTVHVLEANKQLCEGLTKATQYAKQNGVSLARIFLKNQQTLS